jgi:hypothetical protein
MIGDESGLYDNPRYDDPPATIGGGGATGGDYSRGDGITRDSRADRRTGRDSRGRYTDGNSGSGKVEEDEGLRIYEGDTGRSVDRSQVRARIDNKSGYRYYDGLSLNDDGTYEGIEVKSGSANRTPSQRAFDNTVDSGTSARARLGGRDITITSTNLIRV